MNRTRAFVLLMFVLLGAACVAQTESVRPSPSARVTQTESMHTDPSAFQVWYFVEPELQDQAELPVIVYAIKVSYGETLLITSFTADEAKKLDEAAITVQVRDDLASASLISKYDLGTIGQVSFLALRFAPRSVGAGELYLHIDQGAQDTNPMDRLIARFNDPPESSTLHSGRTYGPSSSQTYEQKGYRISFAGRFIPPLPVTFSTPEPPAGVTVTDQATLKIIEISSNQTTYLYIQLLSNGEIRGEMIR